MSLDPTEQQRRDLHAMLDRLPPRQIETLHRQLESLPARDYAPDAFQRLTPRLRWPVFATLAALFYLYFLRYTAGGLTSWFSDDDFMNMHYYWIRPWTTLLKGNILFFIGEPRPLGGLYYMAIHWIWGLNPLPYRVGALILISLNLALLFLVVRELSGSLEAACLSLILTGLNESFILLYYDTGMIFDVLAFFCYYATLYYYVRIRRSGRLPGVGETTLVLIFGVCALNAKEISVSLPIALLLYEILWHPPAGISLAELKRWIIGPARVSLLSGALTMIISWESRPHRRRI